jgi:hypothetical protein
MLCKSSVRRALCWPVSFACAVATGCGAPPAIDVPAADSGPADSAGSWDGQARDSGLSLDPLPYGRAIETFTPGAGAGFGQDLLPGVVLGPPRGLGLERGGTHVLSLGAGGDIVLSFAGKVLVDEPGPDLVVFENPFWPGGDASLVFAELGQVSVSAGGDNWYTWPCSTQGDGQARWPGCAGWTPTLEYDPLAVQPIDPALTGGDLFDLADLPDLPAGQPLRFVRIRDLATEAAAPTAGFDLDAVGLIHWR